LVNQVVNCYIICRLDEVQVCRIDDFCVCGLESGNNSLGRKIVNILMLYPNWLSIKHCTLDEVKEFISGITGDDLNGRFNKDANTTDESLPLLTYFTIKEYILNTDTIIIQVLPGLAINFTWSVKVNACICGPVIVLCGFITDCTCPSAVPNTISKGICVLPWQAFWIILACFTKPVIPLVGKVTDFTGIGSVGNTISRGVCVLPRIAIGFINAQIMVPTVELVGCADYTVIGCVRIALSIILYLPWHTLWNSGACESSPVIVLSCWVTDFSCVVWIVDTISIDIFHLPWQAFVPVIIACAIFPAVILGGQVTDFTSVSVVRVAQVSCCIISLPWIAMWILYACKRCPVIVLSSRTDFTSIVGIVDTNTSCILDLPWLAIGIVFTKSPCPVVVLGVIANFTGIGVVRVTHSSI
jgi:hypothetical protein